MGLCEHKALEPVPAAGAKDSALNLTREPRQETWRDYETDKQAQARAPRVPVCLCEQFTEETLRGYHSLCQVSSQIVEP